jgi:hypothetical protein
LQKSLTPNRGSLKESLKAQPASSLDFHPKLEQFKNQNETSTETSLYPNLKGLSRSLVVQGANGRITTPEGKKVDPTFSHRLLRGLKNSLY